jgi:hypothetical protein
MRELRPASVLGRAGIEQTVESIVDVQRADGSIPWNTSAHTDPWDHVEAAMALSVGGRRDEVDASFRWLARTQRLDGAWAAAYRDGAVTDATLDANFCAYVAAGAWHHWLCFGDLAWLERMWPTVEGAVEFTLGLQTATGEVRWARDHDYAPWPGALLTSSSCIHLSLACAVQIAEALGHERPDWELSLAALAQALQRPELFEPKDRYSMDWYYPILSGALEDGAARQRLVARWDDFVVEGWGVRCVADRPWVTTGETCELVIALALAGEKDVGRELLDTLHRLRTDDGNYWTGATFPGGTLWPREQTTWNAGAVVLALDVLDDGPTRTLFETGRQVYDLDVPQVVADSL